MLRETALLNTCTKGLLQGLYDVFFGNNFVPIFIKQILSGLLR